MFRGHSFDGSCKFSKGGDVELVFDDGTKLVAHKTLLCLDSKVLAKQLDEQSEPYVIKAEGSSPDTWRALLHLLYPVHVTFEQCDKLSEVRISWMKFFCS